MTSNPLGSSSMLSRRSSLRALALMPISTAAFTVANRKERRELSTLLCRSAEGRALSRVRYRNAESFYTAIRDGRVGRAREAYYQTGIVAQLALSAHLLDVGFNDIWCASHIGLDVAKSLECANATGLDFTSHDFQRMAAFLSPYSRWRNPDLISASQQRCPVTIEQMAGLTRDLLDHVQRVTGHRAPSCK